MFRNLQDPLRQFHQATPDGHVILVVYEATSDAASTGVAILDTVPGVAKMNRFYNKLTNTGLLQAFSLMHIQEEVVVGLRIAITVTYSDTKIRFCRPVE